ncbi:MAG TPA: NAD-dependent epimerase/dehydratase family protein [Thermoanaerobaculia bacterium]|nr:NAD-dependent epimerase/dehydratase family protein [Thermoanaerobaculia bacterium]
MRIAFLTGGTGFLGGHVARALVGEGWRVRLLARKRPQAGAGLLDGLDVDVVAGELAAGRLPESAIAGVDAIVHVAGLTKARSLEDYREVNARGTERLLEASARLAPRAIFVHVSSQAAAGPSAGGRPVSESDEPRPISWYGLSKREGEEAVERVWRGPWHIVRPGVVYGPGDRGLLQYFRMAARGWIPVPAGRTRVQIIGAERAALALARAASRPDLAGRRSFLCDPEAVSLEDLARRIGEGSGRRPRLFPVPDAVVGLLGLAETLVERATRRSRPFNADKAKEILAGDWLCDGRPLAEALGLPPARSLDEGLKAAWAWYRAAGWLTGKTL